MDNVRSFEKADMIHYKPEGTSAGGLLMPLRWSALWS
jgi:hypothetical protein